MSSTVGLVLLQLVQHLSTYLHLSSLPAHKVLSSIISLPEKTSVLHESLCDTEPGENMNRREIGKTLVRFKWTAQEVNAYSYVLRFRPIFAFSQRYRVEH